MLWPRCVCKWSLQFSPFAVLGNGNLQEKNVGSQGIFIRGQIVSSATPGRTLFRGLIHLN